MLQKAALQRNVPKKEKFLQLKQFLKNPLWFSNQSLLRQAGEFPSSLPLLKSRCADVHFQPRSQCLKLFLQNCCVIIERMNLNMIITRSPAEHGTTEPSLSNCGKQLFYLLNCWLRWRQRDSKQLNSSSKDEFYQEQCLDLPSLSSFDLHGQFFYNIPLLRNSSFGCLKETDVYWSDHTSADQVIVSTVI